VQTLHESIVEQSEIDELGHLSVPFYEQRALTASHELLSRSGLDTGMLADRRLELTLVDTFSRNLREQFLGASLVVQGGVLDAEGDEVRLYQQIVNTQTDELAAVYVQKFALQSTESRQTLPFDAAVLDQLSKARIDWPEHGQPRSLDLSRPPFQLSLEEARRRDLASRPPRQIELDECNKEGFLESGRFQHLPYSGAGSEDPTLQWVFETSDGTRVGLADLETRNTLLSLPRTGDRIQVYSAEVGIARKTLRRSYWVFNLDSEELLSTGSVVMACLDLDARRALEIAGPLLEMFERRYHPDLS
jgi:acyl-CoA thioesterase FadM